MVFSGGSAHGLVIQYPLSGPGTARRLPFIKRFLAAKKELSHLLPLGKMDTSPISSFIADLFYHRLFYRQLQSDQYHPSLEHPLFLTVIISAVWTCWSNVSPPQRYLAYGLLLISSTALSITASSIAD